MGPTATSQAVATNTSYTSPSYGYSLTWDPTWSVVDASSEDGMDQLTLTNGVSTILFMAYPASGDAPATCLQNMKNNLPNAFYTDFQSAPDAAGNPLQGGDENRVWAVFTGTGTSQHPTNGVVAVYLECRTVVAGQVMLLIFHETPVDSFNSEAPKLTALLDAIVVTSASVPSEQSGSSAPTSNETNTATTTDPRCEGDWQNYVASLRSQASDARSDAADARAEASSIDNSNAITIRETAAQYDRMARDLEREANEIERACR